MNYEEKIKELTKRLNNQAKQIKYLKTKIYILKTQIKSKRTNK